MTTGSRILVVEEDHSTRDLVCDLLTDDGHQVTQVPWAEDALAIFRKDPFPIVITEIAMRSMSGIGLLQKIKEISPDTEVILLTSYASIDTAVAALRCGAYDYLIKPIEGLRLISSVVNRTLEKTRLIAENRRLLRQLQQENDELRILNERLKQSEFLDQPTGLYNGGYFQNALEREVERCREHGRTFSLLLLSAPTPAGAASSGDLAFGPQACNALAEHLKGALRRSDLLTLWGASGFAVLLPETPGDGAAQVADKVRRTLAGLSSPGSDALAQFASRLHMAMATFPQDGDDGAALLRRLQAF